MTIRPAAMEDDSLKMLRMMMLIRALETTLAKRRDHGFQLLSTGEEAVAVGLCSALGEKDQLLTGGRSIGPALARGVDPGRVMAEL
jgi:TPP-dependent pyruvate/acetoin dehydrogenase alpha subunit